MAHRVATSWKQIEKVLWENAHSVFRALRPPATAAQVAGLEKLIGAKLPRAFAGSLRIHDGLRNSYLGQIRLFDYMALLPIKAIASEWRMMCSLQEQWASGGCQLTKTGKLRNDARWRRGWVPILDADGDKLVLDLDPGPDGKVGQVFKFYNAGGTPRKVLADSFADWLGIFAEALTKRQFKLDEGGGIWLHDLDLAY